MNNRLMMNMGVMICGYEIKKNTNARKAKLWKNVSNATRSTG